MARILDMKIVIDMPEDDYNAIRDNIKAYSLADMLFGAVQCGRVLPISENPTNGDVIKALFPDGKICRTNDFEIGLSFKGDNWIIWFKERWWNTPWKENKNE